MNVKMIVALFLLAVAFAAQGATTLEWSAGISHAARRPDGIWYQKSFAHKLTLDAPSATLGVRTDVTAHIALHAGLFWLGVDRTRAVAVADDMYTPETPTHCPGRCPPANHFAGHGSSGGVRLLLEWHTRGAWQLAVLAGPIIYHESWYVSVPDWYALTRTADGYITGPVRSIAPHHAQWALGSAFGLRITHGTSSSKPRTTATVGLCGDAMAAGGRPYGPITPH